MLYPTELPGRTLPKRAERRGREPLPYPAVEFTSFEWPGVPSPGGSAPAGR